MRKGDKPDKHVVRTKKIFFLVCCSSKATRTVLEGLYQHHPGP